jgi:hypothetical protein
MRLIRQLLLGLSLLLVSIFKFFTVGSKTFFVIQVLIGYLIGAIALFLKHPFWCCYLLFMKIYNFLNLKTICCLIGLFCFGFYTYLLVYEPKLAYKEYLKLKRVFTLRKKKGGHAVIKEIAGLLFYSLVHSIFLTVFYHMLFCYIHSAISNVFTDLICRLIWALFINTYYFGVKGWANKKECLEFNQIWVQCKQYFLLFLLLGPPLLILNIIEYWP